MVIHCCMAIYKFPSYYCLSGLSNFFCLPTFLVWLFGGFSINKTSSFQTLPYKLHIVLNLSPFDLRDISPFRIKKLSTFLACVVSTSLFAFQQFIINVNYTSSENVIDQCLILTTRLTSICHFNSGQQTSNIKTPSLPFP